MKFGNLFTITTSAALLLQIGTFVDANPMFAQPLAQHNDDASTQDACSGTTTPSFCCHDNNIKLHVFLHSDMRITFPANQPGQGIYQYTTTLLMDMVSLNNTKMHRSHRL